MGRREKIQTLIVALVVAGLLAPVSVASGQPMDKKWTLVTGTGNFVSQVTRTSEVLDPPCVTLVSRDGNASFSGLIENALADGEQKTRLLRDACAAPVQGTATTTYVLNEATVAGRTGGLILEATGVFEGDATDPAGARTRLHFTIRGVSGDLRGARGTGQHVGQGTTAGSFNTYYAEIWLPDGSK